MLLAYQIMASFFIVNNQSIVLIIMRTIIFLLLFILKPYLKNIEKLRSFLTLSLLIISNMINLLPIDNTNIQIALLTLISLHLTLVGFIICKNSISNSCENVQKDKRYFSKFSKETRIEKLLTDRRAKICG